MSTKTNPRPSTPPYPLLSGIPPHQEFPLAQIQNSRPVVTHALARAP
jgi:hypothetical protein